MKIVKLCQWPYEYPENAKLVIACNDNKKEERFIDSLEYMYQGNFLF